MEFKRVTLPTQTYLYAGKAVPMDGAAISQAMGEGFGEVYTFTETHGIERVSMPSAVYMAMPDASGMTFRTAIFIKPEDASKATGTILSGELPACDAIMTMHVGPYTTMNQTHQALWAYMAEHNIPGVMPIWEIYVDDPTTVPEAECRTEVYRMIGA